VKISDICQMWDGPVSVWSVVLACVVMTVLSGLMGWLRHSRMRAVRFSATLALGTWRHAYLLAGASS
jgi:hypothetical protein